MANIKLKACDICAAATNKEDEQFHLDWHASLRSDLGDTPAPLGAPVKVYAVWIGAYEDAHIDRVYATRKLAAQRLNALVDHPNMQPCEAGDVAIEEYEVIGS